MATRRYYFTRFQNCSTTFPIRYAARSYRCYTRRPGMRGMTALARSRRRWPRVAPESYQQSATTDRGGSPVSRASPDWPGVRVSGAGCPHELTTAWTFAPNPP